VYSGCSAGARGALFNSYHVSTQLLPVLTQGNLVRVVLLLDSAFWLDLAPLVPMKTPFQTQVRPPADGAAVARSSWVSSVPTGPYPVVVVVGGGHPHTL
jgi:hypothetical protein